MGFTATIPQIIQNSGDLRKNKQTSKPQGAEQVERPGAEMDD